jgi:hypothetical protein
MSRIISLGGISGIIALIIVVAMCNRYMAGEKEFPEIMKNALTTILGLYFGAAVAQAKSEPTPTPTPTRTSAPPEGDIPESETPQGTT